MSFTALALIPVSSHANNIQSVFKADSPLSQEAQRDILTHLDQWCGKYLSPFGLSETKTTYLREGSYSPFLYKDYTVELSSKYYSSGSNSETATIIVQVTDLLEWDGYVIKYGQVSDVLVNGSIRCNQPAASIPTP